jgi:hypothetical protein
VAPGARMDVYEALCTTRAMRRVRPGPIPYPVQARIVAYRNSWGADPGLRVPEPLWPGDQG